MKIERVPHTINGKRMGTFYEFDGVTRLYLLIAKGQKTKLYDFKTNSWRFNSLALNEARRKGCQYVGVLHSIGKKRLMYVTNIDDLYGEDSQLSSFGGVMQRTLSLELFMYNTTHQEAYIAKTIKIR